MPLPPNTYTVDAAGCWIWPSLNRSGYGVLSRAGKKWKAHRAFYTDANGPIPEGMTVDHLCFTPACVNPEHLRLLTHLENSRNQRKAFKTHCVNGHEFTPENTYRRLRGGGRGCRACGVESTRRYLAKRAAKAATT